MRDGASHPSPHGVLSCQQPCRRRQSKTQVASSQNNGVERLSEPHAHGTPPRGTEGPLPAPEVSAGLHLHCVRDAPTWRDLSGDLFHAEYLQERATGLGWGLGAGAGAGVGGGLGGQGTGAWGGADVLGQGLVRGGAWMLSQQSRRGGVWPVSWSGRWEPERSPVRGEVRT